MLHQMPAVKRGATVAALLSLVMITGSCGHAPGTGQGGEAFLSWASFAGDLVIVGTKDRAGAPGILVYDRHLRLRTRIPGATRYAADSNGRLISFLDDKRISVSLRTSDLSKIVPRVPSFPVQDLPWQPTSLTPTEMVLRLHAGPKPLLGLCEADEASCGIGPAPPCDADYGVTPASLPGGYALVARCDRPPSGTDPMFEDELLEYRSTDHRWRVLQDRQVPLRLSWDHFNADVDLPQALDGPLEIMRPIPGSESVEVRTFDLVGGGSASQTYRLPSAPALQPYRFLSPRVELAILTQPAVAAQAADHRILDADRDGNYLYVGGGSAPSKLCMGTAEASGKHPDCTAITFDTGTLPQIHATELGHRQVFYELRRPPNPNGQSILYLHGGPDVYQYDDEFLTALSQTRFAVVMPFYTGGATQYPQFGLPDRSALDPGAAAEEAAAVRRDAARRFHLSHWWLVSQSYGGYIAQMLAARAADVEAYITFAGLCSPEDVLRSESAGAPWRSGDPLMRHMMERHETGCEGFARAHVPVIGFVHRDDAILGRNGAAAFAQAILAAPGGQLHESPGKVHVASGAPELEADLKLAFNEVLDMRWLFLYSIVVFATGFVVFILRFMAPSSWKPRLHRLMLGLLGLALAVFGTISASAGISPAGGWLLIGAATFGVVVMSLRRSGS